MMTARLRCMKLGLLLALAVSSGSASAQGADGAFERTIDVGGPVELDVKTGSGRIAIRPGAEDRVRIAGEIRVRSALPADAAFDLEARTGSGGVETSHPLVTEGRIERNRVVGQMRGGGPVLRVRTGSGSVRID